MPGQPPRSQPGGNHGSGGDEQLSIAVRSGMSPMPAFPDLSSTDVDDLIAYISAS